MVTKFRIIAVCMLLTMLWVVGCSSNTGEGNQSETETKQTTAANEKANTSGNKEELSSDDEPLNIQMTLRLFSEVPNMENSYWVEYQKRTNTKLDIEWIPDSDYTTKLNLILASSSLPEVLVAPDLKHPPLINAVKNGAFWDLAPFLGDFSDYPNLRDNTVPDGWVYSKINGSNYGVPINRPQLSSSLKIRMDWLEQLNIPVPTTLDEYREAIIQIINADLDGNGAKDTLGLISKANLITRGAGGFAGAFGVTTPTYDEDGGLIQSVLTPQYTELIAWFRQLYADGVLAKEFSVMKSTQAVELFETGQAASFVNESIRWDYPFTESIKKVQPDAVVDTLPPLQGPGGYTGQLGTGIAGAFFISKQVPEEKVVKILEYFEKTNTPEYFDFVYSGIEGVHYNIENGEIVLTELHATEVGSTSPLQPLPLSYDKWGKVINPIAPAAYNEAKLEQIERDGHFEKAEVDPFNIVDSLTWNSTWPKYEMEWTSMAVKAIVGQITMEEYEAFVADINNDPDIKKAYQEFAEHYKLIIGN